MDFLIMELEFLEAQVHLTVDQAGVVNLIIISDRLLQRSAQLLAVKIDCDVSVGVNITTCRDFSLLTYSTVYSQTNIHSLFIFCHIISFLLLLFNI